MFHIKPRVYDLEVTTDEMHRLKWGLYRDALYQAQHFKKWKHNTDKLEDFIKQTKSIRMHEWICCVLEYGVMHDHERLMKEIENIIGGDKK